MKLLIAFLFPFALQAQTFTTVESVDSSLTKDKLFSLASAWFAHYFKSAQDVIQLSDKDGGKITGKGTYPHKMNLTTTFVDFTLSFYLKDGKYKIEAADFSHGGSGGRFDGGALTQDRPACGTFSMPMKQWKKIQETASEQSEKAFLDFKNFINTEAKKANF